MVPEGLSPPWRDCFIDGQKDVLHGGALSKALVQNAKLKQCSRLGLLFRMNGICSTLLVQDQRGWRAVYDYITYGRQRSIMCNFDV